jgi:TetR/AcrR family transcriptional repressor of nem operon
MTVFWRQGYAATSADDLVAAMQIGRQSLYDTFGDKRRLYLEALRLYHAQYRLPIALRGGVPPLEAIRTALAALIERGAERGAEGCMGINATAAFGQAEPEITSMSATTARLCETAFEIAVGEGKRDGSIAASVDEAAAGRFLYTTLQGLTVRAQAGASPEALRGVVDFAIETLKPR